VFWLLSIEKAPVDRSGSACAAPVIGPLKAAVIPKDRRRLEPIMSIPRSVAEVLRNHVTLEVEGIDRMYLNVYQPKLQAEKQAACFFRFQRGQPVASSVPMGVMSNDFLRQVDAFVEKQNLPVVQFRKGQRKDDVAAEHRRRFQGTEGILFLGKAQEKVTVFRTEKRTDAAGKKYPWIVKSTALVNQLYFYCMDEDFGPFFLKFCTYFPYNAKLCINGHEYVKRQLAKQGIAFEALDNGILSCACPKRLQEICDSLSAAKIDALLRKWLAKLPHPYTAADRQAGHRYDISIANGPALFRGRYPREPGPRQARPSATDLPTPREKEHAGAVSHARTHPRGYPFAARGLQEHQDQAVPQGRPGAAHRDHHQQSLRLQDRQTAA